MDHQHAEVIACLPVHLLIACLQVPQPYHLTTDFQSYMLLGICLPLYRRAQTKSMDDVPVL